MESERQEVPREILGGRDGERREEEWAVWSLARTVEKDGRGFVHTFYKYY